MLNTGRNARDPFTFSLGGLKTIASFAFAPAVASDRIIQTRDRRPDQASQEPDCQKWQAEQGQTAQTHCA